MSDDSMDYSTIRTFVVRDNSNGVSLRVGPRGMADTLLVVEGEYGRIAIPAEMAVILAAAIDECANDMLAATENEDTGAYDYD